jgi:hypothetical protein
LVATAGQAINVPIHIDSIVDLQSPHRLTEADVVVYFDNTLLTAMSAAPGAFLIHQAGWNLTTNIDNELGRIAIVAYTTSPLGGAFADVLTEIQFEVNGDAAAATAAINLVAYSGGMFTDLVDEGDRSLELDGPITNDANDEVDGLLTIVASGKLRLHQAFAANVYDRVSKDATQPSRSAALGAGSTPQTQFGEFIAPFDSGALQVQRIDLLMSQLGRSFADQHADELELRPPLEEVVSALLPTEVMTGSDKEK